MLTDEHQLTAREQELLALIVTGSSNQEIAKHLSLAQRTVEFHLTNIYRKLNVRSRAGAVRYALLHHDCGGVGTTAGVPSQDDAEGSRHRSPSLEEQDGS